MDDSQPKRILLVEDDPDLLALMHRMLQDEFEVLTAKNGLIGLMAATGDPRPDVIVTDVMMPKLDGYEMARRIKQHPSASRIPIIFLTAKDTPKDMIAGIQAGARHYITKPFKMEDLLQRVRRTVKRTR